MSFERFCRQAFERMEQSLAARTDIVFWSAARAIPHLKVAECSAANGIWYSRAEVGKLQAAVSVSLVHGELRVGVIIPKAVVDADENRDDVFVALSPDGNLNDALREVDGGYLYDRSYQDEPFSPQWIVDAYTDPDKAEAVALTMAALVSAAWKAAFNVMAKHAYDGQGQSFLLISKEPLPIDELKRKVAIVIQDVGDNPHVGHFATCLSALSVSEVESILKALGFPNIQALADTHLTEANEPDRGRAARSVA